MNLDELLARLPARDPTETLTDRTLQRVHDERAGATIAKASNEVVDQWLREIVREQRRTARLAVRHAVGYGAIAAAALLCIGMVWHRSAGTPEPLSLPRPTSVLASPIADVGGAEAHVSNLHRYLERGLLPPADVVSTSALVAYFEPVRATRDVPVDVRASSAPMPGSKTKRLVRVTAAGAIRPFVEHVPTSVVALVDIADARHLLLARQTLRALTRGFDSDDQIAIVTGGRRPRVVGSIEELEPTVENSGASALALAYGASESMTQATKHVVVLTDGACDGLNTASRYTDHARLSVLRLGSWTPERCNAPSLAHATRGVYAQVDNVDDAIQLFANPLRRSLLPVVRDPTVRVAATHGVRALGTVAATHELAAGEAMTAFFEVDAADADVVAIVDFVGSSVQAAVSPSGQDATRMSAAAAAIGWALAAPDGEQARAHLEAAAELLAMADTPTDQRYAELGALLTEVQSAIRTATR